MAAATASPFPRPVQGRFPVSSAATCPQCGAPCPSPRDRLPEDAQRRIVELETQVRILTDKATAAVDKIADYEDELRHMKSSPQFSAVSTAGSHYSRSASAPDTVDSLSPMPPDRRHPTPVTAAQTVSTKLTNLLGSRNPVGSLSGSVRTTSPTPSDGHARRESELAAALAKEQSMRQKAEGQVSQISVEVEELSATLFQQANDMVAAERKARAKLEERVEILEKRDGEKRMRLERLEGAVKRIERVRGLLGPQS